MRREPHVRFCERAAVRFLRATHLRIGVFHGDENIGRTSPTVIVCVMSATGAFDIKNWRGRPTPGALRGSPITE